MRRAAGLQGETCLFKVWRKTAEDDRGRSGIVGDGRERPGTIARVMSDDAIMIGLVSDFNLG